MSAGSRPSPSEPTPLWTSAFTALLAAQACFGYAFSTFFLLPTFLSRELGASATQVGWVMSAAPAAVIVLLPITGHWIDRLGRKRFLLLGALLMTVSCALFPLVTSVGPLLYALRVLQAIAFSMSFAAGGALAVDMAPPERMGQAMGLFGLTFLAMNGVAGPTVELLSQHAGWPAAFGVSAVAAAASAALTLKLRDAFVRPSAAELATLRISDRSPVAIRPLVVMASVGLALGAMFNFAQLYAAELGIADVSWFFLAYAGTAVVIRAGFGHLLDDWGLRRVSIASLTLYVMVVAATIRLDAFGLIAVGSLLGISHGSFYPAFSALMLSGASARMRAQVVANVQAAFSVGGTASAVLGFIADRFGFGAVFAIAAASLVCALCLLITERPVRRSEESLKTRPLPDAPAVSVADA